MPRPTEKARWQRKAPHTCVSPHCSSSRSWAPSTHIQLGLAGSTPQEGPLNAGASGGGWLSILSPGCGCPAVLRSPPCSRLPHPSPSGSTPHCPDPGRGLWYWPRGCRGEATQTAYPPVSPYLLKIPATPAPDPSSPAQTHCFQTLGPHPPWGPLSSPRCRGPPGGWQVGTVSGSPHPSCRLGASASCMGWMEAQGCWIRPRPAASTSASASAPWARSHYPVLKVLPLPP